MLFASFSTPWKTMIGPLITNQTDFFSNDYFTISPFIRNTKLVHYKLIPKHYEKLKGSRKEKMKNLVKEGKAIFIIQEQILNGPWESIGEIAIVERLFFNQEQLRFNPFQNGIGIRPYGFIQHLRIGAYKMSQAARPKF